MYVWMVIDFVGHFHVLFQLCLAMCQYPCFRNEFAMGGGWICGARTVECGPTVHRLVMQIAQRVLQI